MAAFSASEQSVTSSVDRVLHAAVAAYLGRYLGQSRLHTGSDLKIFLTWCDGHDLDPMHAGRGCARDKEHQRLVSFDSTDRFDR
jgi:hypothetical protein